MMNVARTERGAEKDGCSFRGGRSALSRPQQRLHPSRSLRAPSSTRSIFSAAPFLSAANAPHRTKKSAHPSAHPCAFSCVAFFLVCRLRPPPLASPSLRAAQNERAHTRAREHGGKRRGSPPCITPLDRSVESDARVFPFPFPVPSFSLRSLSLLSPFSLPSLSLSLSLSPPARSLSRAAHVQRRRACDHVAYR